MRETYTRTSEAQWRGTWEPSSSQQLRGVPLSQRFEEAKALLRKTIPVARRVLGES